MKMRALMMTGIGCLGAAGLLVSSQSTESLVQASAETHPIIRIAVTNPDTGGPIARNETLASVTRFQVTVTTDGVDCAGQFVVTALGAAGGPPSALVQFVPFIIGPAVGGNAVTGAPLENGVLPTGENDFKISASCHGADPHQFAHAQFEFFVDIN